MAFKSTDLMVTIPSAASLRAGILPGCPDDTQTFPGCPDDTQTFPRCPDDTQTFPSPARLAGGVENLALLQQTLRATLSQASA
jgi:hypothetical protein